MAKIRSVFQSSPFLLSTIVLGSLLALAAAARLRFGYPFRSLFQPTCIYIPDDEVVPTLGVFLFALASMVASIAVLSRRSAALRRLFVGVVVGALAFEIGLLVHSAI
jgi:hypothetical protein